MTAKEFLDQLTRLDPRDIGRWPLLFRALTIGLTLVVATCVAVWYFVYNGNVPELRAAQQKQVELWNIFDGGMGFRLGPVHQHRA